MMARVSPAAPPGDHPERSSFPDPAAWPWALVALLPYAVIVFRCMTERGPTYLEGDLALLHVDSLRAAGLHQLLGPYDRFGWHHLGPAYAYLMAAVGRLVGANHPLQAEALTAALVDGLSLSGAALVARRALGAAAATGTVLVGMVLAISLGNDAVFNPWPPLIVVVPLILLGVLALSWFRMGGALPALSMLLVGTFCVQSDVGTAPYVGALGLALAVGRVVRFRRPWVVRGRPAGLGAALVAAAVAVAWVPVAVQQLGARGGNLTLVVRFFLSSHRHAGLVAGVRAAGWAQLAAVGLRPPGAPPIGDAGIAAAVVVVVLAGALGSAGLAGRRPLMVGAAALWLGGTLVAIAAGAQIAGPPYSYLTIWAVAPLVGGFVAAGVLLASVLPAPGRTSALFLFAAASSLAVTGAVVARRPVQSYSSNSVGRAWASVGPWVGRSDPVGVAFGNDAASWNLGTGLVDQLESTRHPVRVLPFWDSQVYSDDRGPVRWWVSVLPLGAAQPAGQRVLGVVGSSRLLIGTVPALSIKP